MRVQNLEPQVLLIMPDRDERSLLMAELQEQGVQVAAEELASLAWHRVLTEGLKPKVVLWDCKLGLPDETLLEVVRRSEPDIGFVFLESIGCEVPEKLLSTQGKSVKRPISVGELAKVLIQSLTPPKESSLGFE
jgi:DNA-binding response OmpR family regulator